MTIRYLATLTGLCIFGFANVAVAGEHDNGVRHYLSLGTSLSVGIQPDAGGTNQLTDDGYADQLHDIIAPEFRKLKLTKLGCPGETTVSMINGGKCTYEEGDMPAYWFPPRNPAANDRCKRKSACWARSPLERPAS